ncbi:MAG: hypothetical protein JKY37_16225 [Nannocystaceae bacterium]|nr:hypothetical protein [Nannocystaceae bacterium]
MGPRGAQWVDDMVVDAADRTHALTSVFSDCHKPDSADCHPAGPRQQIWVSYDAGGNPLHERKLPTTEWADRMALTADGRLALLVRARSRVGRTNDGRGSSSVRLLDPTTGNGLGVVPLDLDAEPGIGHFVPTADGGFIVAGVFDETLRIGTSTIEASSAEWDLFVARFDASGAATWHVTARGHSPGRSGQDTLHALQLLPNGDVAIAGGCRGRPLTFAGGGTTMAIRCGARKHDDAYVARIGADGTPRWVRRLGSTPSGGKWSTGGATPTALAHAPDGGLFVVGLFSHVVRLTDGAQTRSLWGRGFTDTFVVHYAKDGSLVDAWQIGGPGQDRIVDAVMVNDDLWLTGTVAGKSALLALSPSKAFAGHDPENLHLPALGVLVRLHPDDGSHAHFEMPSRAPDNITSVDAMLLRVGTNGLRVAGSFAAEQAAFPGQQDVMLVLRRRLSPRANYESFVWAPTWQSLSRAR